MTSERRGGRAKPSRKKKTTKFKKKRSTGGLPGRKPGSRLPSPELHPEGIDEDEPDRDETIYGGPNLKDQDD